MPDTLPVLEREQEGVGKGPCSYETQSSWEDLHQTRNKQSTT